MYTSAQALCEIFSAISTHQNQNARFIIILADYLGIEGEDRDVRAALFLKRLIGKIQDDFENLEVPDEYKKNHIGAVKSLRGLFELAQIYYTMKQAKDNFLKPDAIVGLMNLHTALDGKVHRIDLREELAEMSALVEKTRELLADSCLDERVKLGIDLRLSQIDSVFRNYRFYGIDGFDKVLSELYGEIAVHTDKKDLEDNPELFSNLGEIVSDSINSIEKAENFASNVEKLADRAPKVAALVYSAAKWIGIA